MPSTDKAIHYKRPADAPRSNPPGDRLLGPWGQQHTPGGPDRAIAAARGLSHGAGLIASYPAP